MNKSVGINSIVLNGFGLIAIGILLTLSISLTPAHAAGKNYAKSWETLGGARWNGYVQIQASYNDNGRHAKQGYHRFMRDAGPSLDTGRLYTSKASSKKDTKIHSRKDSVWDSPLWGDKYVTRYYYGFIYF
ncbi:hypothetical protein [Aeribacillus alveayuensis]|uniref:Lactococcin 972 family bacteriocin n=1 Tax=Aeribacillus alveayuensis TaxID=279215 RepID=A0ABT9VQL3_9BACI|nr:hypothetical protein [Bacillus alveayuensis]